MQPIDEKQFQELLQHKLGESWERALAVFKNYNPPLGFDVSNMLLHATEKGKVNEVLSALEKHFEKHLQFQHPKLRGRMTDALGTNQTEQMMLDICQRVLELQPNSA